MGDIVRGRTVLLVTHNVALVAPVVNHVVCLGLDGRIVATGSPSEIFLKDRALAEQVVHEQEALELDADLDEDEDDDDMDKKVAVDGAKLVVTEEVQQGHVSWKAIKLFFGALSGWPTVFWTLYLAVRW
jgi:ABC-type methionine transport system ATPase subunit